MTTVIDGRRATGRVRSPFTTDPRDDASLVLAVGAGAVVVLAIALRVKLRGFVSADVTHYFARWFDRPKAYGLAGFGDPYDWLPADLFRLFDGPVLALAIATVTLLLFCTLRATLTAINLIVASAIFVSQFVAFSYSSFLFETPIGPWPVLSTVMLVLVAYFFFLIAQRADLAPADDRRLS